MCRIYLDIFLFSKTNTITNYIFFFRNNYLFIYPIIFILFIIYPIIMQIFTVYIYRVVAKMIQTLVFSAARNGFKSVISIFCIYSFIHSFIFVYLCTQISGYMCRVYLDIFLFSKTNTITYYIFFFRNNYLFIYSIIMQIFTVCIYRVVAKMNRTLVFSAARNGFKSVISIFCFSVSGGNISLHFQTFILPLIVIIQWDVWLFFRELLQIYVYKNLLRVLRLFIAHTKKINLHIIALLLVLIASIVIICKSAKWLHVNVLRLKMQTM